MNHREVVLGVRDLVPPEGRVTVQLIDDHTGKVLHKQRSDNLITNFGVDLIKSAIRDGSLELAQTISLPRAGFGWHNAINNMSRTFWWQKFGTAYAPVRPGYMNAYTKFLYLSDATAAVSATEVDIPGTVMGFSDTSGATTLSHTKSGTLLEPNCVIGPAFNRYEYEFGTTKANGTFQSIGYGSLGWNHVAASSDVFPMCGSAFYSIDNGVGQYGGGGSNVLHAAAVGAPSVSGSDGSLYSGHLESVNAVWVAYPSIGVAKWDMNGSGATTAANAVPSVTALFTVTNTTLGSGASKIGVCVLGANMWVGYGTTLKVGVKPTSTAWSAASTYAPAGVGTCLDITTDGTNIYWLDATNVRVIDPATGTVTSSWSHAGPTEATVAKTIGWCVADSTLRIGYNGTNTESYDSTLGTAVARSHRLKAYTLSGATPTKPILIVAHNKSSTTPIFWGGVAYDQTTGWGGLMLSYMQSTGSGGYVGPTLFSRTLLASPITKTSSQALRVTYEFGFS